ncbi:MAG: M20/M25/M40 family metallo-hydrolase [Pseudomonadota bacterium]
MLFSPDDVTMAINTEQLKEELEDFWDREIVPTLCDYIKIPNLSIDFDPNWGRHGRMVAVKRLALAWLERHREPSWKIHERSLPGRTPLILVEIPGDDDGNVMIYGHLDKQPEMEGWNEGLGPWTPVIRDGKLYGRGGADDGYALFAAVAAVKALKSQNQPRPRVVILIEFSEESGSPDLPPYLETYCDIIGTPDLVIALDSGAGDYERLWSTTSLRGMLSCTLTVRVLKEGAHSGIASGIVPTSERIIRHLLDRLENVDTGEIRLGGLHAEIPRQRRDQAEATAQILGDTILQSFSISPGLSAVCEDPAELLLNNSWRPTLCVIGQDGMPPVQSAGNVLRAYTRLKLSIRLPPTVDYRKVQEEVHQALTENPPYNAAVDVAFDQGGSGWNAPALAPWLEQASNEASRLFYGKQGAYIGLGGSIPFMAMLGERYPAAQFLITGVLGPKSNAHGPNEFLHIPYAKKLTTCIAHIVACQAESGA